MSSQAAVIETIGTGSARPGRRWSRRRVLIAAAFLAPALVVLGVLVVYPIVYTIWRSMFDASGATFIGGENYLRMFTDQSTFLAVRNNFIWVLVAPLACTVLGLVFAVLMEKISWKTAFRLIIFMPMAISMLAAGVIFRAVFQENPELGLANAVTVAVHDAFAEPSALPGARPRQDAGLEQTAEGAIAAVAGSRPGGIQDFPLVGIRPANLPDSAAQARPAGERADAVVGTVWLDVLAGDTAQGTIQTGKRGLPGVTVQAVDASSGEVVGSAVTGDDGRYAIEQVPDEQLTIRLASENFTDSYRGVSWLGPSLINVVVILAYVWIWAGFAMIMISSGLSTMDRSLQEAARIDGANEWQVFRRITAPLLAPVLVVVFITLIINVLKIFDLVYVIPPGVSKPAANVIAVEMWNVSFGGGNDHGLGSALAALLLLLVIPAMIFNVRRFRQERQS